LRAYYIGSQFLILKLGMVIFIQCPSKSSICGYFKQRNISIRH